MNGNSSEKTPHTYTYSNIDRVQTLSRGYFQVIEPDMRKSTYIIIVTIRSITGKVFAQ